MHNSNLKQQFNLQGYISPIDVMSQAQALSLRETLEESEPQWQRAASPAPLNDFYRYNAHLVLPLAAQLARTPSIINTVSQIIGDDVMVWACEFIIKEPDSHQQIGWHQDLTYWGMEEDSQQLTAWLALSPSSVQSGCMRFVPQSHLHSQVAHRDTFSADNILSRGQEIAVTVDEADAIHIELAPGQMSLHHGLMFHASAPNTSADRRIGVAIRYITPKLRSTITETDYAMLVAGANREQNLITINGAQQVFGSRELALYKEVANHQSKALSADATQSLSYNRS